MEQAAPVAELMKIDTQAAQKIWLKIYSYECGFYTQWLGECKDNRRFYYGIQSTDAEKTAIAERGQYEIVINKIRKAMRGIVGMVAAAVPQYKLVPIADNDYHTATIGERIIKWAWANSNGIHCMRSFAKNAAVDNVAYFYVYVDTMKMIRFKTLAFNEVLPDPSCTDPLYRDAQALMVRREVSTEYVKKYYNIEDPLITTIQFEYTGANFGGGVDTGYAMSFDMFLEKISAPDQQTIRIYECYYKEPYHLENGEIQNRIRKDTVLGFSHVYREYLDPRITEYPIIPGYVDKAENPYPRGEVHFVKELQRFINKCYGVTLLNAQLLSNPKIMLRETDIPNNDSKTFMQKFSAPGAIGILTAGAEPPIIIQGQPLNQAFFTLYQDAKMEMEYNTIPNQMLGMMDSEKAYQPSMLLDMKQTVLDSFKDFMSNIELACSQLGKVVLQYARAYLPENKIIRIVGYEDLVVNKSQELDVDDERSVGQYVQYQQQRGVPEEQIQQELAERKNSSDKQKALQYFINEPNFDSYDVTVVPGSYTPTYEMSMFRIMMELAQMGGVDPSVPLQFLPVDNREELVARFDTIRQLQGQLEQNAEQIKEYESLLASYKKQIVGKEIEMEVAKGKVKIDKDIAMGRIKAYFDKHKGRMDNQQAMRDLQNEIREILNDVELEAEKKKLRMRNDDGSPYIPDFDEILRSE